MMSGLTEDVLAVKTPPVFVTRRVEALVMKKKKAYTAGMSESPAIYKIKNLVIINRTIPLPTIAPPTQYRMRRKKTRSKILSMLRSGRLK